MNLESSPSARCAKHPSQVFTGFCSSCLLERLSSVDSIGRNPNPNPHIEIAEVRVRKTLLSLFQLDDGNSTEIDSEESREKHLERKHSHRHSCEWRGLERPRHSWDGSVMGKALACSFSCLEDRVPVEARQMFDEMPKSPSGEEPHGGIKMLCPWSRVWDWKDLGIKCRHVLDRSMSDNVRTARGPIRRVNGSGSENQQFRPREYSFGRSCSVHYPSPQIVDNGLLRFYLTPIRMRRTKALRFFR